MEYKGFYAVFYLKARSKTRRHHADPVARYYRWWLALYNTTPSRIEEIVRSWRPLGRRSRSKRGRGFRDIIMDGEVDLVVPAHHPRYYVEFAERLGCRVRQYVKRVVASGERLAVHVPIIEFRDEVDEHVFAMYAVSLATFVNPSLSAPRAMQGTMKLFKWADWLGIAAIATFREIRSPSYAFNDYKRVTKIGKAFTVLADIRR